MYYNKKRLLLVRQCRNSSQNTQQQTRQNIQNATSYETKLSKKEDPQHSHQIKTKPTLQTMEK